LPSAVIEKKVGKGIWREEAREEAREGGWEGGRRPTFPPEEVEKKVGEVKRPRYCSTMLM